VARRTECHESCKVHPLSWLGLWGGAFLVGHRNRQGPSPAAHGGGKRINAAGRRQGTYGGGFWSGFCPARIRFMVCWRCSLRLPISSGRGRPRTGPVGTPFPRGGNRIRGPQMTRTMSIRRWSKSPTHHHGTRRGASSTFSDASCDLVLYPKLLQYFRERPGDVSRTVWPPPPTARSCSANRTGSHTFASLSLLPLFPSSRSETTNRRPASVYRSALTPIWSRFGRELRVSRSAGAVITYPVLLFLP